MNYHEAQPSRYQMVFAMQTDLFPTWKVEELNHKILKFPSVIRDQFH